MKEITLTSHCELRQGDIITIAGVYKRRTFWQWLFHRPAALQQYTFNRTAAETQMRVAQERATERGQNPNGYPIGQPWPETGHALLCSCPECM